MIVIALSLVAETVILVALFCVGDWRSVPVSWLLVIPVYCVTFIASCPYEMSRRRVEP